MLTQDQFEKLKSLAERDNNQKILNAEQAAEEIQSFDHEIENNAKTLQGEWQLAINILLQGRNFIARYHGWDEVWPQVCVLIPGGAYSTVFVQTVDHVLKTLGLTDIVVIKTTQELFEKLFSGLCLGIIEVCQVKQEAGHCEQIVRHDLKNQDGWDYTRAEAAVLPPCFTVSDISTLLVGILQAYSEIKNSSENEIFDDQDMLETVFDFEQALSDYAFTAKEVKVVIIDDDKDAIAPMERILKQWPGVVVHVELLNSEDRIESFENYLLNQYYALNQSLGSGSNAPTYYDHSALMSADIILLDEDFSVKRKNKTQLSGTVLYEKIQRLQNEVPLGKAFQGVVVSTTSGLKPDWAKVHFSMKDSLKKDKKSFERFIDLISSH